MNAIYGLYPDLNSARRAVTSLRADSSRLRIKPQGIVIMSSEPLEEEAFGWKEQRTLIPWLAPLGALLGGSGGYALAAFTQRTYPLPTGGMPIVAMWPTGIIMYELTMLGAILTTIVALLISTRLPNYRKRLYDPEVTNGKILVGVADPDRDCSREIGERLQQEGADQVKEFSSD
jgi:Alternative complex III, ActD subunit